MKLVLIITDYGSFNNFLAELALDLVDKNNEVYLITSEQKVINQADKYDYEARGVKRVFIDFPRDFNLFYHYRVSRKIKGILKEINPDLVHVHFTTGIFTTILSGKLKYYTIGTFHGLGYPVLKGLKRTIFKFVENFCFNRLDEIWLLNKMDFDLVKKSHSQKTKIYKSAGLGCDLSRFNPKNYDEDSKRELKDELGISDQDFVFSFIGRYVNFKGYHLTVKSFLELSESQQNIKLLTMGGVDAIHPTGLNEDDKKKLENNKNVINIGFTPDIQKYLSITDLFVFPSFKEGMPVCIIEALAMEVPVVTLNSRGCSDLVSQNYNGFLVENYENEEELTVLLKSILKDKSALDRLRLNAIKDRMLYSRNSYIEEQKEEYAKSLVKG